MAQQNFPILNVADKNLQLIQANVQKAIVAIQQSPFQGGNYLTGVVLAANTPLPVSHGLGRTPTIWTLGDNNANAVVWRTSWNDLSITLEASAACTINVWVN